MLNLNTSILGRLPVALPSDYEQSKIADVIEAADKQIDALKHKGHGLERLKRSIMSVLLTGEVRVLSDPTAA